jgi:2-polyprenyl-3-methyl-5-hydroxy-6-metoxy-1,4-benzoquinol methylase
MRLRRLERARSPSIGEVSFSFGKNWQRFVSELHPKAIEAMAGYFDRWLPEPLRNRTFLDIGSGSGLSSLVAYQHGARVTSFDVDPSSVQATARLRGLAGSPEDWHVLSGSILDTKFLEPLGVFDVVLSWGVLHHTGDLWQALGNAATRVGPGGLLWIALYRKGRQSDRSLRLKRRYNRTPDFLKPAFRAWYAAPKLAMMAVTRDLSKITRYHEERGMSWWRDLEDWLGGLPYEVASPDEVHDTLRPLGFVLERMQIGEGDGGNDVYLYRRT